MAADGLYVAWALGVVPQLAPDVAYVDVYAVAGSVGPVPNDLGGQVLARDGGVRVGYQTAQEAGLHGCQLHLADA